MAVSHRLTLYGRRYCHLCDDMLAALRTLEPGVAVDFVDVDTDRSLELRYGERVPVLEHEGRELCHYFLDHAVVTAYLASIR